MITPGPWHVVRLPWDDSECIVSSSEDPHVGKHICRTDEGRWTDYTEKEIEQWESNAHFDSGRAGVVDGV